MEQFNPKNAIRLKKRGLLEKVWVKMSHKLPVE
jgi:hypothetical protein